MPDDQFTYTKTFLEENLKKGFSLDHLSELLRQRGIKKDTIKKARQALDMQQIRAEAIRSTKKVLQANLDKGVKSSAVMQALEEKGIDAGVIRDAMRTLGARPAEPITPVRLPHLSKTMVVVVACILVAILLTVLIIRVLPSTSEASDCGLDKACFIKAASACEEARVDENIGDSTLTYRSTASCSIIKGFSSFGGSEPSEVVTYFQGKQMVCSYAQGEDVSKIVDGVTGGLDRCEGLLKDAIYDLRYARLTLEKL